MHLDLFFLRQPTLVPSESGPPSKAVHRSKFQSGRPQALPTQLSKKSAASRPFSANVLAPSTARPATVKTSPPGIKLMPTSKTSLKASTQIAQITLSIFSRPCATASKTLVATSSTSGFEHSQGAGTHRKPLSSVSMML